MTTNSSNSGGRRRWLWPGIGAALLLAWTVYSQATWLDHVPHLQAVPAFFLGLLLLVLGHAFVRLCVGVFKRRLRWLVSGEAWRLYGWTVVFAVSAVALFYALELWRGKRAWAKVVQEASRRGENLDLASIIPPPVPDDQNFAQAPFFAPLLTVSNGVPANNTWIHPGGRDPFNSVTRWARWPFNVIWKAPPPSAGHIKAAPWLEQEPTDLRSWMGFWRGWTNEPAWTDTGNWFPPPFRPVPQFTRSEAATLLVTSLRREFDDKLDQLRAYSDRPYCRFPMDYLRQMGSGKRHVFVLQGLMRILRLRASAEVVLRQGEPACQDLKLALRWTDYARQQPCMGGTTRLLESFPDLLQPVWEGLAERCWTEPQLAALQTQLAALDLLSDYPATVRNDAFVMANFIEYVAPTGRPTSFKPPEENPYLRLCRLIYPAGWSLQDQAIIHRFHLETTSRYLNLAARCVAGDSVGACQPKPRELFGYSDPFFPVFITARLWEQWSHASESYPYVQTVVDLAMLGCALERYRLAHDGFPATLTELVPQFVSILPHDIMTGTPLRYRRTEGGGFVLYAVGFNKTDEGGKPCPRRKTHNGRPMPSFDLDVNDWVWTYPTAPASK